MDGSKYEKQLNGGNHQNEGQISPLKSVLSSLREEILIDKRDFNHPKAYKISTGYFAPWR